MSFLKKCLVWIKKNWKLVLATLGLFGLVFSLYFFRNDLKEMEILKRKIDISKKKKEIIALESQKEALDKSKEENAEKLKAIDTRLNSIEEDVNKRRSEIAKITLNQLLDEADKMGY